MPEGGQVFILVLAIFGVPKLMAFIPNFDPLMVIVGVFVLVAAAQHLGFQVVEGGGEAGAAGGGGSSKRRREAEQRQREAQEAERPASREELLEEADRCLQQNSWARAQELAAKVTDMDPECARAWELLATAQKWDGKREEAAATVKKASEIYEVESAGLRKLAKELAASKEEGSGAGADECEAKGEDFFSKRQYDLAAECYTKALEALGEDTERKDALLRVHRRRAECAQQVQDWSTCRRDATFLLEADPNDARALLQRAAANEALEKFKAALDDARKLLLLEPKNAAANRITHNCAQALRAGG